MALTEAIVCCALLVFTTYKTQAFRILLVGSPATSHLLELRDLGIALTGQGHQVWMALRADFPIPALVAPPPLHIEQFAVDSKVDFHKLSDSMMKQFVGVRNKSALAEIRVNHVEIIQHNCQLMLRDADFLSRLKSLKFDIAIVNTFIMSLCNYALPHHIQLPVVTLTTTMSGWFTRVPLLPSSAPSTMLSFPPEMSLFQRFTNLAAYAYLEFTNYNPVRSNTDAAFEAEFGMDGSWLKIARKSVLFIVTIDHILGWPEPTLPNVIRIPPFGARKVAQLPDHLETIINNAESDIVVVSFGSLMGRMPEATMLRFFAAFSASPFTFLWKFSHDNSTLPVDVPRNVHLLPWIPQNDVLGSGRTKLFVTHCGNGGQYEAVYHGIPMIGFPLFAEQHANAFRMQHKRYGIQMDINSFTVNELVEAIKEVTTNELYLNAVAKASAILKDRPMTSLQTATYWMEHVLQFGDTHLRAQAQDMPWFQFFMLDIFIVSAALLAFGIAFVVFIIKLICKCAGKNEKIKLKKK